MTNKEVFLSIVDTLIGREGIDKLVKWLDTTDFFTAPASTKYHGAYSGGLLAHSLAVYDYIVEINTALKLDLPFDSLAIAALFHDVCKANFYTTEFRNRKTYDVSRVASAPSKQIKQDNNGFFVWESYEAYVTNEQYKFGGHGSKSVYLIMQHMQLTPEEAAAINCHMGAWDKSNYSDPSSVYENNPLAFALHIADECATFLAKI